MEGKRLVILHGLNGESLDITEHITVPNYKVSKNKGYETWTDSNYTTHKHYIASKASGSFTLKFFNVEDYLNFNAFVENNTNSNGTIDATVYYNNLDTTERINAFISYELNDILPFIGTKQYEGFEVSIQER